MTPKELGYTMPPEWAHHDATWLSWPHNVNSWPGKFEPVPDIFIEFVRFLCPHEEVHINVTGQEMEDEIRALVRKSGIVRDAVPNIHYHHNPTNDAWCRDHGPMFILREQNGKCEKAIVDWGYNAWGGKYPPFDFDDVIPTKIAEKKGLPCFHPGIVMEGGSIDVNGKGCLLTTTSCLLNPNRNPNLSQAEIETYLNDYLGVTKILWLGDGIVGDDTDGHIDDISRFVNPTTIVTAVEEDPEDENYTALQENLERLKTFTDQDGKPFNIVTIPMPPAVVYEDQRLPASYANFYIANNVVLVPTYRHENDARAIETLQKLFPTRRVQGIDCIDMIWGLGAIHCVTHEEPSLQA
ncbi:MAG: agmatine deiminase family protein [Chlorobiales bacterium]|jgi:agmatine deiminase|nr:agmatine deiminase family protein [Chlorobiales bacterium]